MDTNQIVFIIFILASFGFFAFTSFKIWQSFNITKSDTLNRLNKIPHRIYVTLLVAFGQQKMFKRPVAGIFHALVWWGFLVITIGTIEIIIDGLTAQVRVLGILGIFYDIIMASGEFFAVLVIFSCLIFLSRRYFIKPKRLEGREMKPTARMDATFILITILFLMISLLGMNMGYIALHPQDHAGYFPVSGFINNSAISTFLPADMQTFESVNWWIHIVLVLGFLNYLPYSKHFHVLLAVPNVFLYRIQPKAQLGNMGSVTREIELMMNPESGNTDAEPPPIERFGVKDVEDSSWKNLMDAYTCTECGRCTDVCPANITGKLLSPRKLYIDLRQRMSDKIGGVLKNGKDYSDNKSLVGDYISAEELWACTSCMACMEECPVNIDHVPFIVDMRRNLVMEESTASSQLNNMFNNIENNGAPWPYSSDDRLQWAEGIEINTVADMLGKGEHPEVLFWVGCAGCFDDRYRKVTRSFAEIMNKAGIKYAVLGKEESCTGDPAKRAGNEFLFQMQAKQNIELLNGYEIKKIVTACPHCFNTIKNEYPELGGEYEVIHHSVYLEQLINEGKIVINEDSDLKQKNITYHDACYLGRGNDIYEAPRNLISSLRSEVSEMKKCREKSMCCGAGGAQMFKEPEKGKKDVNIERTEQALETNPDIIASACPFCMTMMTDGVKEKNQEDKVKVFDIAELIHKGQK